MNTSLRNLIGIALVCAFIMLVAVNAHAGGGKDKVDAAKSKGLPVFVDFGRTTCNPCKMMVPVLDSLTKKYKGRMEVVFVHVDEEKDYALKMGVTMIPTQILLDKNGKEVSRHVGYIPLEDCEKMIGNTVAAAPAKANVPAKPDASGKKSAPGKTCSPGAVCK
jgi:thioredoxin 1